MRVLMVEDAMDLAETVVARLARAGIVCDLAATVEAAEDFRAVQGYDALVLDINLPDGSGLTLLRRIRAEGDRTPVLMLTALVSVDDRVSALDLGADDYLGKPFDQRELEARLRALHKISTTFLFFIMCQGFCDPVGIASIGVLSVKNGLFSVNIDNPMRV